MKKIAFGQSGFKVSRLGLGAVKIGRNTALRYPEFQIPDVSAVSSLIDCAFDLGINLLDTAHAYGKSEAVLGQVLGSRRSDWIISTKAGEFFDGERSEYCFQISRLEQSLINSLNDLRTDYVDIFLLHCGPRDFDTLSRVEVLEWLYDIKKRGMARCVGASTNTTEAGQIALQHLDCIMVTYNSNDLANMGLIEAAIANGRGVMIKKPLDCGRVSNLTDSIALCRETGAHSIVIGTLNAEHLVANFASFSTSGT